MRQKDVRFEKAVPGVISGGKPRSIECVASSANSSICSSKRARILLELRNSPAGAVQPHAHCRDQCSNNPEMLKPALALTCCIALTGHSQEIAVCSSSQCSR